MSARLGTPPTASARPLARRLATGLLSVALGALTVTAQPPAVVALVNGRIIDGTGSAPIEKGVVVIEGNRIVGVGPEGAVFVPAGATRIDAAGGTVLPGLTDLHTHTAFFQPNPREFEDDSLAALRASSILREALDAGITLMRDAGARHGTAIGLKQAILKGYIEGPRFVVCNNIVGITGAHGTESDRMLPRPKILLESDGPTEWRRHIRQNFKLGADYVKVTPPFTKAEIEVAVEEAHNWGALIAVDAAGHQYPGMMMVEHAVAAGADTIEHLYGMKNEARVIEMMREQGTILVPTVSASRRFAGARWTQPTEDDEKHLTRPSDYEGRFRRMHAAGVKMAIGTDTGGKDIGEIGRFYGLELELFRQWGASPAEIIQSATRVGAEAAGLGDRLGTLQAGKLADVIVVRGDPLQDLSVLTRPVLVMKDGVVLRDRRGGPATNQMQPERPH